MAKNKKYYEVVFNGNDKLICGMLEGFMLGSNEEWFWRLSNKCHIEAETMTQLLVEWATGKNSLHNVIIEEDFHKKLQKAAASGKNLKFIKPEYTKSAKEVESATLKFTAKTFSKEHGDKLKEIFTNPPETITIEDYEPKEIKHKSAKGIELYAPDHDYIFKATGIAKGDIESILKFRKVLDNNPLIEVTTIRLNLK